MAAIPTDRVRPHDAASLILVRHGGPEPLFLLGRRHAKHRFAAEAHAFPGGRVDPLDRQSALSSPPALRPFIATAVRETAEETGLVVRHPERLLYLGRAVTPAGWPLRFHARFFLGDAADCDGSLTGSGELLDLDWYPLHGALQLRLLDVTEFMLGHAARQLGHSPGPAVPFYRYRNGRPFVSYDRSAP